MASPTTLQRNPRLESQHGTATLTTLLIVATTLLATWLWPPTRASWDAVDLLTFRTLNNTLQIGSVWQTLVAFLNTRIFDAISGIIILALIATAFWERRATRAAIVSLGLFACAMAIGRHVGSEMIVSDFFDYQRPSPTLTLSDTHRLSELVPTIIAKDASPWSFPGDHGFVVLGIAVYMSFWAQRRAVNATWTMALLVTLPRLISGGHWLSDILVGSLSMALLTMALLMASGLHDWLVNAILQLFGDDRLDQVADAAGESKEAQPENESTAYKSNAA